MNSDFFTELRVLFEKLPGIGPRQASRFIWSLVDFTPEERKRLSSGILILGKTFSRCRTCHRIYGKESPSTDSACSFCQEASKRDQTKIMVVERDNDLINIEKAKVYDGLYHVLGGAFDPLYENGARQRIKSLYARISNHKLRSANYKPEIILALAPTKMGEFTANYIEKVLEPSKAKVTRLGRGLSTGVDLEYADELTLKQALYNRK